MIIGRKVLLAISLQRKNIFLIRMFLRKVNLQIRIYPKKLENEENHRAKSEINEVIFKVVLVCCVVCVCACAKCKLGEGFKEWNFQ